MLEAPLSGHYKIGTLAKLSGFTPLVLRAWEQRHGLLRPERGEGGQRRYTELDLRVLRRARELLDQGLRIGEVAALGRDRLLQAGPAAPELPAPQMVAVVAEIVAAAAALDAARVHRALDDAFARVSPEIGLYQVLLPAAERVGNCWARGELSVSGEHLATAIFVHRVGKLIEGATRPAGVAAGQALFACFPGELHELGGMVVTFELVRAGVPVTWLGASVPFEDLDGAVALLRPRLVLLSVSRQALFEAHRHELLQLVRRHGPARFCLGGAGVPEDAELAELGARLCLPGQDPRGFVAALV